jgi:hypothetical protein
VRAQETYDCWLADFDAVKPKHDAAVAKLKKVYLECQGKLVDALMEAQAVDAEVRRVANAKPYDLPQANGDGRNFLEVELAARGITGVGLGGHSLMKDVKLPDFGEPAKLAWPPPTVPLGVLMAQSMTVPPGPGPDWHRELEERDRKIIAAANDAAAHYNARQKEREAREKAEGEKAREADREWKRSQGWPV